MRSHPNRARYFESYVQAILGRDLPSIADVRVAPDKLNQLLHLLAARSGNLASFAGIAARLELDSKTVRAYTALLEELFIIYRLRPWSRNLGARHVKTPKLFLTDTGMMSALITADATRFAAIDQGELAGLLLETFVVADTRGLRFLRDKLGERFKAGVVLYTGARTLRMGERIWAVPLRGLWAGGEAA